MCTAAHKLFLLRNIGVNIWISSKRTLKMQKSNDNRLHKFREICDEIASERSYLNKVKILQDFFYTGSDGFGFKGDILLWVKMLIPSESKRIYNLQNKQMLKLFSRIFASDLHKMQLDLEQEGDVSETLRKFFEESSNLRPQATSKLYLQEVEEFLEKLVQKTKEDEQTQLLKGLCQQTTSLDLKMIIRIIKQDLRINAGARHILDAFGPTAYPMFQSSRDLASVVKQFAGRIGDSSSTKMDTKKQTGKNTEQVHVMTPISPMLACACKSVDEALKKNPSGLFSEIKYDGERVQIHKNGKEFKYFSRNLKPVMEHKIKRFKEFITKAFPQAGDMILDSEIILVDTKTGDLLPFGSLGTHKKKEYENAEVCLFVFDCLLLNGEDLTSKPFRERRQILEQNITPIKSYVQLSESQFLKTKQELALMTAKVFKANLEGLVLKNPLGTYQPGKRGWLKVKRDYLFGGQMADTADLVVLGAWFGSGKKGGMLSIFLMGCYDPCDKLWKTVTKVHSGLDDATMEETHKKLMKLMERSEPQKLPNWLFCKKALVPDFIAKSPDKMPVWEITGAEFSKSDAHTADGISIRFPRITKIRDDKTTKEANDLNYLQKMFEASKQNVNVDLLMANCGEADLDLNDQLVEVNEKTNFDSTPRKKNQTTENDKINLDKNKERKRSSGDSNECSLSNAKKTKKLIDSDMEVKTSISNTSAKGDSKLFHNIIVCFHKSVDRNQYEPLLLANGGIVTTETKKAELVLYNCDNVKISQLGQIRETYQRSCRHLNVKWMSESIEQRVLQSYPLYAVTLE